MKSDTRTGDVEAHVRTDSARVNQVGLDVRPELIITLQTVDTCNDLTQLDFSKLEMGGKKSVNSRNL